ncbi:hypothetical protein [Joostella sp. CR20]|uniref:hypothetical protein n=1 Tax=Joostella sp. CR20 TaxID=2804312 RepID=UPI00313B997B
MNQSVKVGKTTTIEDFLKENDVQIIDTKTLKFLLSIANREEAKGLVSRDYIKQKLGIEGKGYTTVNRWIEKLKIKSHPEIKDRFYLESFLEAYYQSKFKRTV